MDGALTTGIVWRPMAKTSAGSRNGYRENLGGRVLCGRLVLRSDLLVDYLHGEGVNPAIALVRLARNHPGGPVEVEAGGQGSRHDRPLVRWVSPMGRQAGRVGRLHRSSR